MHIVIKVEIIILLQRIDRRHYGYYNKQDAKNALTVTEKKWVEENKSNVIDFSVINDYPLYGLNGKGVFFNFLKDFEQDVGLEFNKVSYLKEDILH